MRPIAYRLQLKTGDHLFINSEDFDRGGVPEGALSYGLFLSPRLGCPHKPVAYLGEHLVDPTTVPEGVCPVGYICLFLGPLAENPPAPTPEKTLLRQVRQLCNKLAKFHWSPAHPTTYTLPHPESDEPVGIGLVAMRDPGAFNLAYTAVQGALHTMDDHRTAINLFVRYKGLTAKEVDKQALGELLTLFSREEFTSWIKDAKNAEAFTEQELTILHSALQLHEIRRV